MPIRITGMNSGLDTEALVSELVSAYRKKSEKYTKAQTKLSWKQEAWKDLNKKVSSFYSSINSLKYTTAYNTRKATSSDATKAVVTASSTAAIGTYSLKIEKVAKSGYLTGAELNGKITADSNLAALGYTGKDGMLTVTTGGKTQNIEVNSDTKISDFIKSLNDAGVNANFDAANHRIFVAAAKSGKDNDFTLTGANTNGNIALSKLGLSVDNEAEMKVYKEYAAYARNTAGEAYITYDANGTVQINGSYDAGKTRDYIENIKTGLGAKSAAITNSTAKVNYANAYQTVTDANNKLSTDQQTLLKTLGTEANLASVYVDANGNIYDKKDDDYIKRGTGNTVETFTEEQLTAQGITLTSGSDKLTEIETAAGTTGTKYASAWSVLDTYAASRDDVDADAIEAEYAAGTLDTYISEQNTTIAEAQGYINAHSLVRNDVGTTAAFTDAVTNAAAIADGTTKLNTSNGAVRILGQDTEIVLNGARFRDTDNEITVNGLSINAMAVTTTDISISVTNDSQGVYDKVKSFIKGYNTLVNEMTALYNADSAKGYEPLTSEEKDAMTDTEVEEWEKKIKDSLLRRDDQLDSLLSSMKSVMFQSFTINGKSYSLSSFGISTVSIISAADNEENAFHIAGDSEDSEVSGETDKLLAAIQNDPEVVQEFMMKISSGLYDVINKKMSSSTLSSFGMVYNDKEMAREYSDYTKTISKWEEKLADIEDSYYKKFAAMESALATLQSQQSSLASMLGM